MLQRCRATYHLWLHSHAQGGLCHSLGVDSRDCRQFVQTCFGCKGIGDRNAALSGSDKQLQLLWQAAVELTEAQQQDLMLLRCLFYGRMGQLLRERRSLLSKVQDSSGGSYWNREPVQGAAEIAQQLRSNGIEEYRTYMQFASTFFRGVRRTLHTVDCPQRGFWPCAYQADSLHACPSNLRCN